MIERDLQIILFRAGTKLAPLCEVEKPEDVPPRR